MSEIGTENGLNTGSTKSDKNEVIKAIFIRLYWFKFNLNISWDGTLYVCRCIDVLFIFVSTRQAQIVCVAF